MFIYILQSEHFKTNYNLILNCTQLYIKVEKSVECNPFSVFHIICKPPRIITRQLYWTGKGCGQLSNISQNVILVSFTYVNRVF